MGSEAEAGAEVGSEEGPEDHPGEGGEDLAIEEGLVTVADLETVEGLETGEDSGIVEGEEEEGSAVEGLEDRLEEVGSVGATKDTVAGAVGLRVGEDFGA